VKQRKSWIGGEEPLPVSTQCQLVDVNRTSYYGKPEPYSPSDDDLLIRLIEEEYALHPFYGSRRMRQLGLAGMAPGPNTSKPHPEHKVYPYLLRGVSVTRPNQVWSTDITYCRLPGGFMYLTAIIDWYSRKALARRLSNSMESSFCVECLEEAPRKYGVPEIFNSDQGAQFTSDVFIGVLKQHETISISMDGRGRALDNIFVEWLWRSVKHEDMYLKGYGTPVELKHGLAKYFDLYNTERPHQSLGYRTPDEVYASGTGGGACIVDKFSQKKSSDGSSEVAQQQQSVA
jgi:putative transposase